MSIYRYSLFYSSRTVEFVFDQALHLLYGWVKQCDYGEPIFYRAWCVVDVNFYSFMCDLFTLYRYISRRQGTTQHPCLDVCKRACL